MKKYLESGIYMKKALQLYESSKQETAQKIGIYNVLGKISFIMGKIRDAENYFEKSIDYYENTLKSDNNAFIANSEFNLGCLEVE